LAGEAPSDDGFTFQSTFPELDFARQEEVRLSDKVYLLGQLSSASQIRALHAICSEERGVLRELLHHLSAADPPLRSMIPGNWKEGLRALSGEIRAGLEKKIEEILGKPDDSATLGLALDFLCFLREPDENTREVGKGLYVPKPVRKNVLGYMRTIGTKYCDARKRDDEEQDEDQAVPVFYRAEMRGYTNDRIHTPEELVRKINERLRDGGGESFLLAEACRGFFVPFYRLYEPKLAEASRPRRYWKRNLSDPEGDWVIGQCAGDEVSWHVPVGRMGVSLHLIPIR
jgi:hypothetical protein